MNLTVEQIQYILELICKDNGCVGYGPGAIGKLQAKLSILKEIAIQSNNHSEPIEVKCA